MPLMDLITSVNEVSMKILFEVMKFTPLGVLCTIMPVLATTGADTVVSIGTALLTTYAIIIIYAVVVYGIIVGVIAKCL